MLHNRRPFLAARLLACVCIAASSLSPSVSLAQTYPEETVQIALKQAEQGGYTGVTEKRLGRLGDASAVALTKLLADKPIADAGIPPILLVVKLSYSFPEGVEDAAERQPRTTLYLLRSLSQATKDPKLVSSIDETAAYVKSQYAAYLGNHPDK